VIENQAEKILLKKAANYFVPADEAHIPDLKEFSVLFDSDINRRAAADSLSRYVKRNGLWIGGTIFVSETAVFFKANAVNARTNTGNKLADIILLQDVTSVEFRKATLTHIVSVTSETGLIVFRCFGAKKVHALLQGLIPGK